MRRSNSGGFEGPWELFRLPRQLGDEFFDKSMAFVEGIFGKNAGGLVHLMNEVEGKRILSAKPLEAKRGRFDSGNKEYAFRSSQERKGKSRGSRAAEFKD